MVHPHPDAQGLGRLPHMPRPSVRKRTSRVYKHTVTRQLELSLTLPQIKVHGFTHPQNGHWLMLPREFSLVLALETKAVAQVILAVFEQTIGYPGDGPHERRLWAPISPGSLARQGLMSRGAAWRGLQKAVQEGYLLRRAARGNTWEYAIRWKGIQN
jgi:hypothetical protein